METVGEITTLDNALKQVADFIEQKSEDLRVIPSHRRYFGFWFRGQVEYDWDVIPALYRVEFDEASMFQHFKILRPEYNATHGTDFEWLTLMQHFSLPTRLVDWTENLLVGLFFALWHEHGDVDEKKDGALFILSARKLNHAVISSYEIEIPDTFHVAMRTALVCSETEKAWLEQMRVTNFLKRSPGATEFERVIQQDEASRRKTLFSGPVAVFPGRKNDRLIAQAGVFTIHGGKEGVHYKESLPAPVELNPLNNTQIDKQKFIWKFRVKHRKKILEQLKIVGVHEGTLFADLDHQAQYLRKLWEIK